MKRCPKCGAANYRPGQKFCGSCGAPLSETPPQAAPAWPPQATVQRRQRAILILSIAILVVLLAAAGLLFFALWGQKDPPATPAVSTSEQAQPAPEATPVDTGLAEERRLYLDNLTDAQGMVLTADGVAIGYETAADGRLYIDRNRLTGTDVLLRAIQPVEGGWQTALALVSKPSNPTASFGSMAPCEEDGYNQPDGEYLDAMLTVYYRSQLKAFNSRQVSDLRFSTDLNDQSWEGAITMGAYDALAYDLEASDMGFTDQGLAYGEDKVTFNAAGHWVGTNRNTGEEETGTDYMTIQAIWRDGIWQVDRCIPCTQQEYESGTLKLSTH